MKKIINRFSLFSLDSYEMNCLNHVLESVNNGFMSDSIIMDAQAVIKKLKSPTLLDVIRYLIKEKQYEKNSNISQ